jgi:integrase
MARGFPRGIRARLHKLQMLIKRPGRGNGGWDCEAAVKLRAATQAIIDSGDAPATYGRMTVSAYSKRWLADRRTRGLRSVNDDEQRLEDHVLSHKFDSNRKLGSMFMDEVRPLHARAIIRAASEKGLAPRTIINVNSIARQLFLDAVSDEILTTSPWNVPRKELPKKRDKSAGWRASAKFTVGEILTLLWAPDELVPWDRRMFYALMYFGALRFGEASGRRWCDRIEREPQRAIHVHSAFSTSAGREQETKTQGARLMPEHPTLTTLLNRWKLEGWPMFFGRLPTDTDLIVPSRWGRFRRKNHSQHKLHEDLARLGLRPRRQHDLRRSFIGHAVDAGAARDRLRPGTHGVGMSVMELYDSPEWAACCEHVLRLKVEAPAVVEIRAVATGTTGTDRSEMPPNSTIEEGDAGPKPAKFRGSDRTGAMMGPNSIPGASTNKPQPSRVSAAVSHVVPASYQYARGLLDACGGDVEAALAQVRAAAKAGGR